MENRYFLSNVNTVYQETYKELGTIIGITITFDSPYGLNGKQYPHLVAMYSDKPGCFDAMLNIILKFEDKYREVLKQNGYDPDSYPFIYIGCENT